MLLIEIIKNYIILILQSLIVLSIAIVFHELAHWFYYYRKFGFKFNIHWWYKSPTKCGFRSYFPNVDTKSEQMNLLFSIFVGMVVIIFFTMFKASLILALVLYMYGCRSDLDRLQEIVKQEIGYEDEI